ncbi:MAG: prepilin-type N-terminal cleavage/methylation domain-containing protein [Gemmatimonadaceae bacterium]
MTRSSVRRGGFTLLELMLAIVITGLVTLIAYSAITVGLDTQERVERHRREAQSRALFRPFISDALRHIADVAGTGTPVFLISAVVGPTGGESVTFLTRGVQSPLGSSGLWRLTLIPSAMGLHVQADPLEDASRSKISSVIPGVTALRLRILATRQDKVWVSNWDATRQQPYAVKIELLDSGGRMFDSPLVVATAFERGGQ